MWLNIYVGYAFPMERIHIGCSLMVDMRGVFSIEEAQNDADLDRVTIGGACGRRKQNCLL